jgi:hypothetical protein
MSLEPVMKVLNVEFINGIGPVIYVEVLKPTIIYGKFIVENPLRKWPLQIRDIEWPSEYQPNEYRGSEHIFPVGNKQYVAVKIYPNKIYVADLLLGIPSKKLPDDIDSAVYYEENSKEIVLPVRIEEPVVKPKKKTLTLSTVEILNTLEEIKDTSSNGLNECIICCKNTACILFNCGHIKTCAECSLKIMKSKNRKCTYCRADIIFIHKAYL